MPFLLIADADLCVVREMGKKNYSGTGMDTNVIGRLRLQGECLEPAELIQFLSSPGSVGGSHGYRYGLADFTTERLRKDRLRGDLPQLPLPVVAPSERRFRGPRR